MLTIMKTLLIIVLTITVSIFSMAQSVYYVSLTGNDGNSGLSEAEAWRTITYAASSASPVAPGDTVYIKAGDYGDENVVFETDGTETDKIIFEGYQSVPGDNPALNYNFGDPLDASLMPLLDGGDRTIGGIAMTLYRQHVEIKNFQIKNYNHGIYAWHALYVTVENVIAESLGDVNQTYDGYGIVFAPDGGGEGGYNTIKNCVVVNAAAEGITAYGNNNVLDGCRVYCNEDTAHAAMDYYIVGHGNNNLIENCHVERIGDLTHGGHGINLKGNAENNIIRNCTSKNTVCVQLRHRGIKNNTVENCIAEDTRAGFLIRDGASNNVIRNSKTIGCSYAVSFMDTTEDDGAQYAGRYNVFENCLFIDSVENVIYFDYYSLPSVVDNNSFVNCVIDGGDYLFGCDRENNDNKMVNCIVTNVQNFYRTAQDQEVEYPLNFDFEYSLFYNNGFDAPAGTAIFTFEPGFVDLAANDYHLTATSQCIDTGTSEGAPQTDFDGNIRPFGNGWDIGAYEFIGTMSNDLSGISSVNEVLVFPNPTSGTMTISGQKSDLIDIKVYNTLGQDMTKLTRRQVLNDTPMVLNLSELSDGIYLVKTISATKIVLKK